MPEQRNLYQGSPLRPWVRVVLVSAEGLSKQLELLADTGNPCALIVSADMMREFNLGVTTGLHTNFGVLDGGWLRVQIPELPVDEDVLGYGSDAVVEAAKSSHAAFAALVGLPLLRMMQYGGDSETFWVRPARPPTRAPAANSRKEQGQRAVPRPRAWLPRTPAGKSG